MSKLPVIKAKELLKILQKMGFVLVRQSGSHVQFVHPDGRRTTVPNHPSAEIRKGTLRGIIGDIDLTVEEFIEETGKKK